MSRFLNSQLEHLTETVLASYDIEEKIRRVGETYLPSRSNIVKIVDKLRQLLFPGFFGHKGLTTENIRFHLGSMLASFSSMLSQEIVHCACVAKHCKSCLDYENCCDVADVQARDFILRIPKIREFLAGDAQAAFDGDPAAKSIDEIIYCYPGYFAITVYRIAHELAELGVELMPRIISEYAHSVTGADIHPDAKIGRNFFIDHATGVVIGQTATIGNNCKIYQGVTLGAKSFPKDERGRVIKGIQRHPTLEDDVTIYSNTTVLGGDTVIGKGVTIGGNAFITESVGPDSTVIIKPAKFTVRSKKRS